jgi:putative ATP-binding cassette transporter
MNLFHEFSHKAPNKVFFSIGMGAVAGLCYALLIPVVLNSVATVSNGLVHVENKVQTILSFEVSNFRFACLFFLLCTVIVLARSFSQIILTRISIDVASDLRLKLYQRIIKAPIASLDTIGPSKLVTLLSDDVRRVVFGGKILPDLLVTLVTVVGMLCFLFYLNTPAFWFVLKALLFGVVSFQLPVFLSNRVFVKSSHLLDRVHLGLRGLIYGIKELKLDATKRQTYFRDILHARERELAAADKLAFSINAGATAYGDLISFFVIGVVAFIFVNYHSVDAQELVGIIMVLLYITGPVAFILASLPSITMAKISLKRIEEMLAQMPEDAALDTITPIAPWQTIHFEGVCYQHAAKDDGKGFQVGPIDMEIDKGDITFIVGGNGSGKSTLSKVLALYYFPSSGTIRFGNERVTSTRCNDFRQELSAIFSDYFLFDRLLGETKGDAMAMANAYLNELGLEGKVAITDGVFSTLSLSDGQRKRLALLVAFMEDKPLYLFDEWAADQDPVFKDIFYNKILPDLKQRGKAVVVISHDDRYFDVADKVIFMEDGKIASIKRKALGEFSNIHQY